jgi:alpha-mannosidase
VLVLLPCQSLEDLVLDRPSEESEEILSAWTALFHPALLELTNTLPAWDRASYPMKDRDRKLAIVPPCCEAELDPAWSETMEEKGAKIIRGLASREEIVEEALRVLELEDHGFDAEAVEDYFSLGYCYIVVELLTRQLRYMSNLDEVHFESELSKSLKAYREGDQDAFHSRLRAAFDLIAEGREYFYPVETNLLDILLTAPTTVNDALAAELDQTKKTSIFLQGATLRKIAGSRPDLLEKLKKGIEEERLSFFGGEDCEWPLPLLPLETLLRHLRKDLGVYEEHLGERPLIFARYAKGLTPGLPQLLKKLGYKGVLQNTFDGDGRKQANQSKVRWKGDDGSILDSSVRFPLDASDSRVFLKLPQTLGETMDLDHASTTMFARWPGRGTKWFDAILRMSKYSPSLGGFERLDRYFTNTQFAGQTKSHASDSYRARVLEHGVAEGAKDSISRWRRFFQRNAAARMLQSLSTLEQWISGKEDTDALTEVLLDQVENCDLWGLGGGPSIQGSTEEDEHDSKFAMETEKSIQTGLETSMQKIAQSLPVKKEENEQGILLVNPYEWTRRVALDVGQLKRLPDVEGPVLAAQQDDDGKAWAVADIPPMGYAWVGPGKIPEEEDEKKSDKKKSKRRGFFEKTSVGAGLPENDEMAFAVTLPQTRAERRADPGSGPKIESYMLRNEYFEVKLDPLTGTLQSLLSLEKRGNRLGQQLAFRFPKDVRKGDPRAEEDLAHGYSIMAADSIKVVSKGPLVGSLRTKGRLLDVHGKTVAKFVQTHTVRRASRVLEIEVELDPIRMPEGNPWDCYFGWRFAWGSELVDVFRDVHSGSVGVDVDCIESPRFIEVQCPGTLTSPATSTTFLTDGSPFHRRFDFRRMDTPLIVQGETGRSFRIGVALDVQNPLQAAVEFISPEPPMSENVIAPRTPFAWLRHIDVRNLHVTDQQPLFEEGRLTGVRMRLLETEGRAGETTLQFFRPVKSAVKSDFLGNELAALETSEGSVSIPFTGRELAEIRVDFARE